MTVSIKSKNVPGIKMAKKIQATNVPTYRLIGMFGAYPLRRARVLFWEDMALLLSFQGVRTDETAGHKNYDEDCYGHTPAVEESGEPCSDDDCDYCG
jgi:hypothetical protein